MLNHFIAKHMHQLCEYIVGGLFAHTRLLDKEYTNAIKSGDAEFDYTKLPSPRELSGEVLDDFMVQASSALEESRKKSWNAAFSTLRQSCARCFHSSPTGLLCVCH